jgi:hypothetical protein
MVTRLPDPDPATVEAIAEWLETGLRAFDLPPKIGRALADRLRAGQWVHDPDQRSAMQILSRRVDDKLLARAPLTDTEKAVAAAKIRRKTRREQATAEAFDRVVGELERHANNPKGQE